MLFLNTLSFQIKKSLTIALLASSGLVMNAAFAADANKEQNDNIEVTQQNITPEELAAIYVLSEICPKLIEKDQNFSNGYQNLLKDYMPNQQNAANTLKQMTQQAKFQPILTQARQDAKKAGDQANRDICMDVVNYQPYK